MSFFKKVKKGIETGYSYAKDKRKEMVKNQAVNRTNKLTRIKQKISIEKEKNRLYKQRQELSTLRAKRMSNFASAPSMFSQPSAFARQPEQKPKVVYRYKKRKTKKKR